MPQIFHRSFNVISKVTIFGAVFIVAAVVWAATVLARSSYLTNINTVHVQPVPFSHEHQRRCRSYNCRC